MADLDCPPVRYSVGQKDYDSEIGARLRIYCDGVLQTEVVEYDCDAGTILRNVVDAKGHLVLNEKRDEVRRETVIGNVTVQWKD